MVHSILVVWSIVLTSLYACQSYTIQTPYARIFSPIQKSRSSCGPSLVPSTIHPSTENFNSCLKSTSTCQQEEITQPTSVIGKLRHFSLSTASIPIRATTGLSLTAIRSSLRALTGVSITKSMKSLIGILPPWARYFIQPFLILYYIPITTVRAFVETSWNSKAEARESHEKLVESWREALQKAETKIENWPVSVAEDGSIKSKISDPSMVNEIIVDAIEMKYEEERGK